MVAMCLPGEEVRGAMKMKKKNVCLILANPLECAAGDVVERKRHQSGAVITCSLSDMTFPLVCHVL